MLLQYLRSDSDAHLLVCMNIAYVVFRFVASRGIGNYQAKGLVDERTWIRFRIACTVLHMLFVLLSTRFSSVALALAVCSSAASGLYFSASALDYTDCVEAENLGHFRTSQRIATMTAPLSGSAVLMLLFILIEDTWATASSQTIIHGAILLQSTVCISLLLSLSHDNDVPTVDAVVTTSTEEHKFAIAPLLVRLSNHIRGVGNVMMFAYFPYYAVSTLGLNPHTIFVVLTASQGTAFCLVLAQRKLNGGNLAHVSWYLWGFQLTIPLVSWIHFISLDLDIPMTMLLVSVALQNSLREEETDVEPTTLEFSSTSTLSWGITDLFVLMEWIVSIALVGEVANRYGLGSLMLPIAIVSTVSCVLSLVLFITNHSTARRS